MRFPVSSTGLLPLRRHARVADRAVPEPADAGRGQHRHRPRGRDLLRGDARTTCRRCSARWPRPGRRRWRAGAFTDIQAAIRARDVATLKTLWNELVPLWDDRTFYDFVATSEAFSRLSFRHREVFGQVGFGTGGWDSDFPNSMLEIFRVVDDQLRRGPAPRRRRRRAGAAGPVAHAPAGARPLASGHHARVAARRRAAAGRRADAPGRRRAARRHRPLGRQSAATPRCSSPARAGCSPRRSTATSACSRHRVWMALDRTRYMQSSKTFVMVDRPFWKDRDPRHGRGT